MHLTGTEFPAATVVSAVKRRCAIHDQQGVSENKKKMVDCCGVVVKLVALIIGIIRVGEVPQTTTSTQSTSPQKWRTGQPSTGP